ncbi:kinase-like domain-containing protein [Halteromyces radiatus]|uniref:kinase-like domain-containing protein n=1 Tax=Halteromyces radiatus TaxID=101107 RepID=UPI00221E48CF|nr:kinase-like domain-containing protein [Halteromyces radiatus]KAI8086026.1 kinase-like domain-containing protein [Halteromyces radiatus]
MDIIFAHDFRLLYLQRGGDKKSSNLLAKVIMISTIILLLLLLLLVIGDLYLPIIHLYHLSWKMIIVLRNPILSLLVKQRNGLRSFIQEVVLVIIVIVNIIDIKNKYQHILNMIKTKIMILLLYLHHHYHPMIHHIHQLLHHLHHRHLVHLLLHLLLQHHLLIHFNLHHLGLFIQRQKVAAKRKFIKMIQAAYRFRQENKQDMPSEMEILFDSKDNIQRLRLWIHDKIQYHTFKGDAQYIPPELSNRRTYHCDLVDVWVLGISLYRMLVGKYPFHANNDRRLFNKMQHADFGIPSHLSSDAKDLLRRMLAPDHSRASLDLVMFHPWLKPYTVVISNNNDKSSSSSIITPSRVVPSTSLPTPLWHPSTSTSYHINTSRRKKSLVSHLTKVMVFIIEGPYPPPRQPYRDLSPTIRF